MVGYFSSHRDLYPSDFWGHFTDKPLGDKPLGSLLSQISGTMLVTLWMYIGIEGAVVMSDKASPATVSRATLLGFIVVTVLYVLISVLPFGVLSQGQLAALPSPSTAAVLGKLVGEWGLVFVNLGVIVALLSSWLVWTLLCAELPWACAKDGTFPKFFAKTNSAGVASGSLWVSTWVMQAAMLLVYFSNNAWNIMLAITGVVILPAYIGSPGYLWKEAAAGRYPEKAASGKTTAIIVSVLATIYGFWLCYAAGLQYMLVGAVVFALGLAVFVWRREEEPGRRSFTKVEMIVAALLVAAAVIALWMLFTGHLPQVYKP